VWRGLVTNDTFHALRAFTRTRVPRRKARLLRRPSLVLPFAPSRATVGEGRGRGRPAMERGLQPANARLKASRSVSRDEMGRGMTQQLLARHGVLTRESLNVEAVPGVRSALSGPQGSRGNGRIRRGYSSRPGRDAVRLARRPRSAAIAPGETGRSRNRGARGDRSGESLRRGAEMARLRAWRRFHLRQASADGREAGPQTRPKRGVDPRERSVRRSCSSTAPWRRTWRAAIASSSPTCPSRSPSDRRPPALSRAC
jgi:hypothetical protein